MIIKSDILADCASSNNDFLQTYLAKWSSQFGDVPEVLPTKQPFWDRPRVLVDKALVELSCKNHILTRSLDLDLDLDLDNNRQEPEAISATSG